MADLLYRILIYPLVLIVELIFSLLYGAIGDAGLSIVGLSIAVSTLVLPLYQMADAIQEDERQKQERMSKWVDHIKAHFKGDEQYMILTTYYRQQGYSQLSALRSSVSLLLQVPFFIAAYRYLSQLELLSGTPFLLIADLSKPDALFTVGTLAVNVLPIVMTLLNLAASLVYTWGRPLRDQLQTYGLALLFLVLLYNSPSGLVLYWTCNQIYSLAKNVATRLMKDATRDRERPPRRQRHFSAEDQRLSDVCFVLSGLIIAVFVGLVIPSALLSASPREFVNLYDYVSPLTMLLRDFLTAAGMFVLWASVFYFLSTPTVRHYASQLYLLVAAMSIYNYLVFGTDLGVISNSLVFEKPPTYSLAYNALNVVGILCICAALFLVQRYQRRLIGTACAILIIAAAATAVPNIQVLVKTDIESRAKIESRKTEGDAARMFDEDGNVKPLFKLSRNGRNVVVLFLDRAINGFVPYMMNERPELVQQFDGFTYYPNAISYGPRTVFGAPSIYGGYDYTPEHINEREDESLEDKHNEALQVLPSIMADDGFDVTLTDPALINYSFSTYDYSIFEPYDDISVYHTEGAYTSTYSGELQKTSRENTQRNLFFYGIFKVAPTLVQPAIYDKGTYHSTLVNYAVQGEFINSYSALLALPDITEIDQGSSDNLLMWHGISTHTCNFLQLPDYTPTLYLHNEGLEDYSRFTLGDQTMRMDTNLRLVHYHANIGTFIKLGEWFDYLREQGVYDNTRIIIVSDHGYELGHFDNLILEDGFDVEMVNALFMYKDFDSTGFDTSYDFMTTGDVPILALQGIDEEAVNPFTGNPIYSDEKNEEPQLVTSSVHWKVSEYQTGNTFDTSDGHWYAVHDNIFEHDNWERMDW